MTMERGISAAKFGLAMLLCFCAIFAFANDFNNTYDAGHITWKLSACRASGTGQEVRDAVRAQGDYAATYSDVFTFDSYTNITLTGLIYANADDVKNLRVPQVIKWNTRGTEGELNGWLRNINSSAISENNNIVTVALPYSIKKMHVPCFKGCSNLTSIKVLSVDPAVGSWSNDTDAVHEVKESNTIMMGKTSYITEDGVLYSKDKTVLLKYPEGKEGSFFVVPETVTELAPYCLANVNELTIQFSGVMPAIDETSFSGSTYSIIVVEGGTLKNVERHGATSVTIPDGVTSIGDSAFAWSSGLTSVTIPDSVTSIGEQAFYNCRGLTSVTIGDGVTSIGDSAFRGCGMTGVTIPDSVTSIGVDAFYDCTNLTGITIGNGVISIGTGAFKYCRSLTSVTIPDSVTSIGPSSFQHCDSLTSVTIGSGVTNIVAGAFAYCAGLLSFNVVPGNPVYKAVSGLLLAENDYGQKGLLAVPGAVVNVAMPEDLSAIASYAFAGCSLVTSVVIPDNVQSIGDYTFDGCSSLTSVTIPDSVLFICDSAFSRCSSLTNIVIPDCPYGTSSIRSHAFSGCSSLTNVTISDSVCNIDSLAFANCNQLLSFNVAQDNWWYKADSGLLLTKDGRSIVAVPGGLASVTIPDSVTSIGRYAFYGCNEAFYDTTTIPGVKIVDGWALEYADKHSTNLDLTGVRAIGGGVFSGCALTSVTIPDGVTCIGYRAFANCVNLSSVTIPDSVKSIGDSAFDGCNDSLYVANFIPGIRVVDGWAIGHEYPISGNLDLTGIRGIADGAFKDCVDLTSVMIPDSVKSIGDKAFRDCDCLTSVTIGDGVTSIGDSAFRGCGMTGVTIPDSVTSIGVDAFSFCTNLTSVTIGNGVTSIGYEAFYYCDRLQSVVIPDSVTSIGSHAFYGCSGLTSVAIGSGVTNIEYEAFAICRSLRSFSVSPDNPAYKSVAGLLLTKDGKGLVAVPGASTEVTIPDGVTNIGAYAFECCNNLTSVMIPTGVTSIGNHAFSACYSLTSVTIPDGVTSIGNSAFRGCGLTRLTIPDCVTSIGDYAFAGCDRLASVTIGDGVTSIEDYAFSQCYSLTSVKMGNGVTSIEDCAFRQCYGLTSVTIPSSVTIIRRSAFYMCNVLRGVSFEGDAPTILYNAFERVAADCTIYVRENSTGWCVDIPGTRNGMRIEYIEEGETPVLATYTVAFFANGGIGTMATQTFTNGVEQALAANRFTCEDHTFDGWATNANGVVVYTDGQRIAVSSDMMLYAHWTENGGGSGGGEEPMPYGTPIFTIVDGVLTAVDLNGATNVVVPARVTVIDDNALCNCYNLSSVTIPSSMTRIGALAFAYCYNLKSVTFEGDIDAIDIAPSAFDGTPWGRENMPTMLIRRNEYGYESEYGMVLSGYRGVQPAGEMVVSNGVTVISGYAFQSCTGLISVAISSSVTNIGAYAFGGCYNLRSVTFEGDIDAIDIDATAFRGTPWEDSRPFEMVVKNGTVTGFHGTCPATITAADWPDGVAEIGAYAFQSCAGLTNVTIPDGVTNIGAYAFAYCYNLTSVAISSSVTSIGASAFQYCSSLSKAYLPRALEGVVDEASVFYKGDYYQSVSVHYYDGDTPAWVEVTFDANGGYFYGGGISIVGMAGEAIGELPAGGKWQQVWKQYNQLVGWFTEAEGGVQVTAETILTKDMTTLYAHWRLNDPEWYFEYDYEDNPDDGWIVLYGYSLPLSGEVVIPSSIPVEVNDVMYDYPVRAIEEGSFYDMTNITSVVIPANVTYIGDWAFEACSSLTSVTFEGGIDSIEMNVAMAFYGTPWLENAFPPPYNDDFADAATITGASGSTVGTNICASVEDGEPLTAIYETVATVWWKWTASADGLTTFSTKGSNFDTVLGVYTGNAVASLETVAVNDDGVDDEGVTSTVSFEAVAGTTYYIAVGGYGYGMGNIVLSWDSEIPQPEPEPQPVMPDPTTPVEPSGSSTVAISHDVRTAATVSAAAPVAEVVEDAASVYDGYVYEASGALRGTIQVKLAKAKNGVSKATAVIQLVGEKKQTVKGDMDVATGTVSSGDLTLKTDASGLTGRYGSYEIDGVRSLFASKDAGDKVAAAAILARWQGVVNVAWSGGALSVSVAAKGKAKVSGTLSDGTKVSASGQLVVGDEWCCVPVAYDKGKVSISFALWLSNVSGAVEVAGLTADAVSGRPGALMAGAKFRIDSAAVAALMAGARTEFLPDGVAVTQSGAKWVLPKAGKVVFKGGVLDESKLGENPSGLKLSSKAKDGSFKGSFKVYAEQDGKLKATTVNVAGVMIGGVGYGVATSKKPAVSWPVTVQ